MITELIYRFMDKRSRRMTSKPDNGIGDICFFNPEDTEGAYNLTDIHDKEHLNAIAEHLHTLENSPVNFAAFQALSSEEKGAIIAKLLIDAVNSGNSNIVTASMNNAIRWEHRYLQAQVYAGICNLIGDVADDYDNRRYDARNAVFVRMFKAVADRFLVKVGNFTSINDDNIPGDTVGF